MSNRPTLFVSLKHRLANRADSEHGQAIVRLVIASIVAAYFFSDFFSASIESTDRLQLARSIVLLTLAASMTIFA